MENKLYQFCVVCPYLFVERQFVFWRVKLLSKQIVAKTLGPTSLYFKETETKKKHTKEHFT